MRAVLAFAFGTSLAIGLVFACTGEDVQNGDTPVGRERGPCFADNTCEGDLLCLSARCVRADGSASTSPPGQPPGTPPPPSSSDAGGDAGVDCGAPSPPTHTDGVRCLPGASACEANHPCLASEDGGMECVASNPGATTYEFDCFETKHCPGADHCCAKLTANDSCTVSVMHANCHGTCNTDEVELCADDAGSFPAAPCANGMACVGYTATYSPSTATRAIGACGPPPK